MRIPTAEVIDHWGSTAQERQEPYPCDDLMPDAPMRLFRAVDVEASPEVAYRWLCQLRAAPYSYDWIDNGGRRSPRKLTPGLEQLEIGQRVMTIFRLAQFVDGESITATSRTAMFGEMVVTYRVKPRPDGGTRLVAKLLVANRRGPFGWFMAAVLPVSDLVMMRKQLLNLKELAERSQGATA